MKRSLLDTHVFLWFVEDNPRLTRSIRGHLEESDHSLFLSAISAFEIAIKFCLGRLLIETPLEDLLTTQLEINSIKLLPVLPSHLTAYAALPFPGNGHRDPFDRFLVAQSQAEGLALITMDKDLAGYGVIPYR